jgi:hypothetical protein
LEEGIGLSPPVAAAVDEAARVVTRLVTTGGPRQEASAAEPQQEITANGITEAVRTTKR